MGTLSPRRPFHYGLVIILAGVLTIFACLGLGRFALGMLLPSMGSGLALSYAQMGVISTGNFFGYLCGVLIRGSLVRRLGGQILGPTLAGILADASGSFHSSYLLTASMTTLAFVLTMLLRNPSRPPSSVAHSS